MDFCNSHFHLFAIINHIENKGSNDAFSHFVSYIFIEDQWYEFNDSIINQIAEEDVFRVCNGGTDLFNGAVLAVYYPNNSNAKIDPACLRFLIGLDLFSNKYRDKLHSITSSPTPMHQLISYMNDDEEFAAFIDYLEKY